MELSRHNVIDDAFSIILTEEDAYQGKGSGFRLKTIDGILLSVYSYNPMGGSSYIKLPREVENKKSVINPQNNDQHCFKWAILVKHVTGNNRYRVGENYSEHEEKYNFNGLHFPTPPQEVNIFENNNPTTSINVYGLKQKKNTHTVFPLKVTKDKTEDQFDLLLLTDKEKSHYSFISNFSFLVRAQKTKHREEVVFVNDVSQVLIIRKKLN